MTIKDLARSFKQMEAAEDTRLVPNGLFVVRLDGANFSKFTRQFQKPFSKIFEYAMNEAAECVTRVLPNQLLVYVGSDEISLIGSSAMADTNYGGRISKILSLTASYASVGFLRALPRVQEDIPAFDARVIQFSSTEDILDYVTWRRLDVRKNAISMAAETYRSHKQLMGVSTRERAEILVGTPHEHIPEGTFNGRFLMGTKKNFYWEPATRELAEELCDSAAERHQKALEARQNVDFTLE